MDVVSATPKPFDSDLGNTVIVLLRIKVCQEKGSGPHVECSRGGPDERP